MTMRAEELFERKKKLMRTDGLLRLLCVRDLGGAAVHRRRKKSDVNSSIININISLMTTIYQHRRLFVSFLMTIFPFHLVGKKQL